MTEEPMGDEAEGVFLRQRLHRNSGILERLRLFRLVEMMVIL